MRLAQECAAMAEMMLDAELYAIARRAAASGMFTPLQLAVEHEIARRKLAHFRAIGS